jgi:hypothetical protein
MRAVRAEQEARCANCEERCNDYLSEIHDALAAAGHPTQACTPGPEGGDDGVTHVECVRDLARERDEAKQRVAELEKQLLSVAAESWDKAIQEGDAERDRLNIEAAALREALEEYAATGLGPERLEVQNQELQEMGCDTTAKVRYGHFMCPERAQKALSSTTAGAKMLEVVKAAKSLSDVWCIASAGTTTVQGRLINDVVRKFRALEGGDS